MRIKSTVLAILLATASTAAWAQATTTTTTTTTEVTATKSAPAYSLFPESSVYLWTRYYINRASTGKNDLIFTPHFSTPILNNFVTMDAYADIMKKDNVAHGTIATTFIDFTKVLVNNENFYVGPYLELVNPGRSTGGQALVYLAAVAKLPVQTSDGTITPFLMTESAMGINTTNVDLADSTKYLEGNRKISLTGEQLKAKNIAAPTESGEYVYDVYGRVGFEFDPAMVPGLKLTAATNILAAPKNEYTVDVASKKVTNVDTSWQTTTQPMLRLEYTANKFIHLRNDVTYDMQNYFGDTTAKQAKAGKISNMTRLTYTIY